jgi:hypothetical protein
MKRVANLHQSQQVEAGVISPHLGASRLRRKLALSRELDLALL